MRTLVCWHWHVLAVEELSRYLQGSWSSSPSLVSFKWTSLFLSLTHVFTTLHAFFDQENLELFSLQFHPQLLQLYIVFSLHMWVSPVWIKLYYCCSIQDFPNSRFVIITCSGSAGLSLLQFCNLNSFRIKFILGFSVFMGLSIPHYFNEYTAVNGYGPVHTGARWVTLSFPFNLFTTQFWIPWRKLVTLFEL